VAQPTYLRYEVGEGGSKAERDVAVDRQREREREREKPQARDERKKDEIVVG